MPYRGLFIAGLMVAALTIQVFAPSSSHALSDEEYRKFTQESPAFRDAEKELNGLWKKLTESLSPEKLGLVKSAQRDWVFYARDAKAKKLIRDKKIDPAGAYAIVTRERSAFLGLLLAGTADSGSGSGLSGTYDSGMGTLKVQEMQGGRIKVHLTADWPSQRCSGELPPTILSLIGNRAVFSDDRCPRLVFVFSPGAVEVTEDERCGYHGLNCYFDGTYKKSK